MSSKDNIQTPTDGDGGYSSGNQDNQQTQVNNNNTGSENNNNSNGQGNNNNRRTDNRRNLFNANERTWEGDKTEIGAVLGLQT